MIHYQLTEEEVVRGMIKYRSRRRRVVLGILLVLLGILEFFLGAQTRSSSGYFYTIIGCVFIAFGVMSLLLTPLIYRHAYLKVIRANPSFTAPKEVSFDEKGMTSSSSIQKLEVTWAYFKRITQDENYFYLHIDNIGNVSLLPKDAFDEVGRQEFLRCSQSVARA